MIHWIIEEAREYQKNFCFIDYTKVFDYIDHNKLWKILQEMGIPDHLTSLLRSLYSGQEATVRTEHGTMDWFQVGNRVLQGCILSPCLFNFYSEYIIWNAGLDEAQAGVKIAGRNINNFRYTDGTTIMEGSKEKLKLFFFFFFFTVQVFIFTPIRPWIHREWAPTVWVPFHWSLQSVLLWVEQAGTSAEPKSLPLWLPSFSDHFPSHVSGSYLGS